MNITTIMLTAQSDLYSALTIITASQMKMHIIMLQYTISQYSSYFYMYKICIICSNSCYK